MLDRLTGNGSVKTILRRLLASGNIPHSLLFTGAEGIGKREFALEIAKAMLCKTPVNNEACDNCSSCKRVHIFDQPASDKKDEFEKVFFSEHPDVGQIISAKSGILVKAVRALEREANFRPYEGTARFFIIDDADKMNDHAANALLKTLEEPPSTSYLFLISSRPDSLLRTILSRCQRLRFAPLSAEEIKSGSSERSVSNEDAHLVASLARGSFSRASEIDLKTYRERRSAHLETISAVINQNFGAILRATEQLNDAKNKENFEADLETIEFLLRDIWMIKNGSQPVNSDITANLQKLADSSDEKKLTNWLEKIENARADFVYNVNKKIAMDALFLGMD